MSSHGPVFVGIDGGGTSTDLAMVDADGHLVARVQGKTSNKSVVGFDGAMQVLASIIDEARATAGVDGPITSGWVGLAGSDRPEDRTEFTAALRSRFDELRITNDAELVLSGTTDGIGIALIAGTGSIAFARNEEGATGRSGGWGHIFGDEGSAYMVAVDALRAVAAAADGRGPATHLTERLLAWWNVSRPQQLIPRIYASDVRKADIAASAPGVVETAESGDAAALGILHGAADDLAELVHSLARRVPFASLPDIAGTGGLLLHTTIVRNRVEQQLDQALVRTEIQPVDDIAVSAAQAMRRHALKGHA